MVQRLFADVINDAIWFMNIHEKNHPWFLAMAKISLTLIIQSMDPVEYFDIYYIHIYIYVWKLNQTVLELDFRAVKFLFFPRRDLNSHHWYIAAPFAWPYVQGPRPLDHIHSLYIYIISVTLCFIDVLLF